MLACLCGDGNQKVSMVTPIKLKQYSSHLPCYYCGAQPPSSREHAPPKMMFRGFQCDKITVPSCSTHNTEKSQRDRGIITGIIMAACKVREYEADAAVLTKNVVRAIREFEKDFSQAKNEVVFRDFIANPPQHLQHLGLPFPYLQASVDIEGWVRQLTAALVWSVTGKWDPDIDWDKTIVYSPNYYPDYCPGPAPMEFKRAQSIALWYSHIETRLQYSTWYPGWSSGRVGYPSDLYSFELCFLENEEEVILRHRFYNNTAAWYAVFTASAEAAEQLVKAVGACDSIAG